MTEEEIDAIEWMCINRKAHDKGRAMGRCHEITRSLYRSMNTSPVIYRADEERRWYVGAQERSITESSYHKAHGGRTFERKDMQRMEIKLINNSKHETEQKKTT